MKIFVHQIPVQNKLVSFFMENAWAVNALEEASNGKAKKCQGELVLHRRDERVRVSGDVELSVERTCDICGSSVELTIPKEVLLTYEPLPEYASSSEGASKKEEEFILEEEDLELGWYEHGQLDLAVVLGEHVVLNLNHLVQCADENVLRLEPGECKTLDREPMEKEPKNTYKPFANLNL